MISGRGPFGRETAADTIAAILNDVPASIASSGEATAGQLALVVSRCLEKEPDDRFTDAGSVAAALRSVAAIASP